MSTIFRLYNQGSNTLQDWSGTQDFPYNQTARATINDPQGATAKREITSIPSPFARIDLVKSAFAEVNKLGVNGLNGNTIFHKMVSDTLDIAEIFFKIDTLRDKIQIIVWDKNEMLQELQNSNSASHKHLADTLQKFFVSDADVYNFNQLNKIYLLNYIQGPQPLNIIGATSPATLFFSTANNIDYINDIQFGNDRPFDSDYQPLYSRDIEFVKYLYGLSKSIENFANLFSEVNSYLQLTYEAANEQLRNGLREVEQDATQYINEMPTISIEGTNDEVEVLGKLLHKKNKSVITSDFQIKSEIAENNRELPFVLPIEKGTKYAELQYVTDNWGNENVAPYYDKINDIAKRQLPKDGSVHAYLTISDLLEEFLIRLQHKQNTSDYFDGNINIDASKKLSFLLPIKPLFFKYFTVEQLMGNMPDGQPMFMMESNAGGSISVTIRIPIIGSERVKYIEYKRKYSNSAESNLDKNEGGQIEIEFAGLVMPMVKFNDENDALYNVACIQSPKYNNEFTFYRGANIVQTKPVTTRGDEGSRFITSNYVIDKSNFDYIQVSTPMRKSGIIIPKFKTQNNIETFKFSVDLGTTNTHIECAKNNDEPHAFTLAWNEKLLCKTIEMSYMERNNQRIGNDDFVEDVYQYIEKDFIPTTIGNGDFKFPTRTALSHIKSTNWNYAIDPFTIVNNCLTFEKRRLLQHNDYSSNIKWNSDNDQKIKVYVRGLMLMLRNKVLLNNGNLRQTKIVWFYPISMSPNRRSQLKQTWDTAYQEYFGGQATNCIAMTESDAPVQYVFKTNATAKNLVNIDIGGGTTDIAFATNGQISYVTSFLFATNNLFEDAYAQSNCNGIVDYYKTIFDSIIPDGEPKAMFKSMQNLGTSNLASFFFSLKNNSLFDRINNDVKDFGYKLQQDEDFKILIIIFYASIIYHIAQITKLKNIPLPRHISFCGNGSKIVGTITNDLSILSNFTKKIYELVLGQDYNQQLDLFGLNNDENPKESTCKGGIVADVENTQASQVETIIMKSDGSALVNNLTYNEIDENYRQSVVDSVIKFFDFVLNDLNNTFNFNDNFGISNKVLELVRNANLQGDYRTFIDRGIEQRTRNGNENNLIEETFFFYAIKGALQELSIKIYEYKNRAQ